MIQNVPYSNGLSSHVTLAFEYWTTKLSGIQMNLVFKCHSGGPSLTWIHIFPSFFFFLFAGLVCRVLAQDHT